MFVLPLVWEVSREAPSMATREHLRVVGGEDWHLCRNNGWRQKGGFRPQDFNSPNPFSTPMPHRRLLSFLV
jgi:hypothetical protein